MSDTESPSSYVPNNHGPDFQRLVLRLMMLDRNFSVKASVNLQEGFFSGELRWFFKKAQDYQTQYSWPIPDKVLKAEIFKHGIDAPRYEEEYSKIIETRPESVKEYIQKEVTGFIRANIFVGSYREAASLYNAGSKEDAYQFTSRKLQELLKVDFARESVVSFGDHVKICDEASRQTKDAIPTGIHFIDLAMNGGLMPGTWTTFLGGSNVGKSMLCPNLAYYACSVEGEEKNTFVTIHEDEEIPTKIRYLSRFSGVPYNRLTQPRQDWTMDECARVSLADEKLAKHVKLKFMFGTECFLEKVVEAVKMLKYEWDFHLYLCDYGQCLKTKAFKSMENAYAVQEYIYQELKQLCLELNLAGAGGAQVNRQGHKTGRSGVDFLRMTDVGESWGICKKASNIITMNRSEEMVTKNEIVFLLDKVRNGRCPVATVCHTDYGRAVTHHEYQENLPSQSEIPVAGGPTHAPE